MIFFLAVITLPVTAKFMGWQSDADNHEKRRKAPVPALEWRQGAWASMPPKWERYFNDNFGLRDSLVMLGSYFKFLLFKSSANEKVLIGGRKWLFYNERNDGDPVACYRGTNLFSEKKTGSCQKTTKALAKMGRDPGRGLHAGHRAQ